MFKPLIDYLPKQSGETLRLAADVIADTLPEYVDRSFIAGGAIRDMSVNVTPPSKDVDWFVPFDIEFEDDGEYKSAEHKRHVISYLAAEKLSEALSSAGLYSSVLKAYGQSAEELDEAVILPSGKMKQIRQSNFDENIVLLIKISDRPINEKAFTIDLIFSVHGTPEDVANSFDVNINACWLGVYDNKVQSTIRGYPSLGEFKLMDPFAHPDRVARMKDLYTRFF